MINLDEIKEIYEISPVINENLAVFPGDIKYSRTVALSQEKSDHLDLSSIQTSLHIGAHADAPCHYSYPGESIEQRSLIPYMGRVQVVSPKVPYASRILPEHFNIKDLRCSRVLFKTESFDPYNWNENFNSLSPECIEALAKEAVNLVGIDTPSVDPHDSKNLESHNALLKYNFSVLEGLDLRDVPDGDYQLIALPLRLEKADASPVRAILIK